MSWSDEAEKFVNEPVILIEIDWDSGTRKYSVDYISPTDASPYKGNVLRLPSIFNSIGDVERTFESSRASVIFDDTDYEFRTLSESEGMKGRTARIKIAFVNLSLAANYQTVLTCQVYSGQPLRDLQYEIVFEQESKNFDNEYPLKKVDFTDYPNAADLAKGAVIPVPWGTVSALGLSGDGACPALMVDTTQDAEVHLVGLQAAAITVSRVYINKVLKTLTTHYTIATQVISGKTHTEIRWVAGVRPTEEDTVSCDLVYGSREPCEAFRYFMTEFCEYLDADFDATSYAVAYAKGVSRSYTMDGLMVEQKTLKAWRDMVCDEFQLDIWIDPKDGLVHFHYLSGLIPVVKEYRDDVDILDGYQCNQNTTSLLNYLTYGYNYNFARDYFNNYSYREDAASQIKQGGTYREFKGFYFIRDISVATDIAVRKIIRRNKPLAIDLCPLPIESFDDDMTDIIRITHFEGPGADGYVSRTFQVRKISLSLDRIVNTLYIEDVQAFFRGGFILGDEDVQASTWITATVADQYYGYLCDETTEQFSDGEPGKIMLD